MNSVTAIFGEAIAALNARDVRAAETKLRQVVDADASHVPALNLLTVVLMSTGRFAEAEPFIARAVALNASSDVSFYNYGLIAKQLNKAREAHAHFSKALAINPNAAETWNARGAASNDLQNHVSAIADFDGAIRRNPNYAEAYANKGKSLLLLKRRGEALAAYDKALLIKPLLAEALVGRGNVLCDVKRYDEALAAYDKALSIRPDFEAAWLGRGNALNDLKRYDAALAAYDKALSIRPDLAEAWLGRGNLFARTKRSDDAVAAYAKVKALKPDLDFIKGQFIHQKMFACDWSGLDHDVTEIEADIHAGRRAIDPFAWQGLSTSEESLQLCARIWNEARYPRPAPLPSRQGETQARGAGKIRIGYVSGEFREQATSHLIVGLFEAHDKARFDVVAFDNGFDDASPMRGRIESAMDRVVSIRDLDDAEAAKAIYNERIDILVNLNGYFGAERTGVFAYRPAPVQVNYLGFPGTLGAPYIDYIVADRCVLPPEHRAFYDEKVVYLPHSYQANDRKKAISARVFSRAELDLPAQGAVFCCFNNSYKIAPSTFASWIAILQRVDASVLWLLEDNDSEVRNLRNAASQANVDPSRLIFAPRMPLADHLARHRAADVFLDTLPYNAHTTASDALWAGLPLVTQIGSTFAGRVAASLLNAIGLPELITHSHEDYEALAIELALDKEKRLDISARLDRNRLIMPAFDTALFARHMEAAYAAMYRRHREGLPPDHLAVDPVMSH